MKLFGTLRAVTALLAVASVYAEDKPHAKRENEMMGLMFPLTVPEAPAIYHAVAGQELVAGLKLHKAQLIKTFDPAKEPLKHRGSSPAPVEGAYASEALSGTSGSMMLWGPYTEFPKGDYLVVYRYRLNETSRGTLFFDVSHNACTRSGIRKDTAELPIGKWQEVAVPVRVSEDMKLEFRFWPDRNPVSLDRIYVFKVKGRSENKKRESQNLPPGEKINGRTDVVTSPFTDDDGMIDVTGLKKGARVRCPYTGKEFRVP